MLEPAAISTSSLTTVPGASVLPMPTNTRAPMTQSCRSTLCPIVQSSPIVTGCTLERSTELS